MSAFVFAWPSMPQPPSGDSAIRTACSLAVARLAGGDGDDFSLLLRQTNHSPAATSALFASDAPG
jgi:hypothetical protein